MTKERIPLPTPPKKINRKWAKTMNKYLIKEKMQRVHKLKDDVLNVNFISE